VIEHGTNAKEREVRHQLGGSSMACIVVATSLNAEIMGWNDRVGSVEPGKFANLTAVPGDPLQDITQLQEVGFVMKIGQVVRDELVKR
jgi:imidazolonepropionase-like amidohydrolase